MKRIHLEQISLKHKDEILRIKKEYAAEKQKTALFEALGVKTAIKGLVKYKDGKYEKE